MAMNDGNPFLNGSGTIAYPPRGKDNPHFKSEFELKPYIEEKNGTASCYNISHD